MRFQPLPDGEPMLDTKQFLHRLQSDPRFVAKMRSHYEAALALPENEDTAEMQKAARAALRTLKHHQGLWHGVRLLTEARTMMTKAMIARDPMLLQRLGALVDEARDHFLDVLEPERTKAMTRMAEIRETIQKMRVKG